MDLIIPVFNRPFYTKACLDSLLVTRHGVKIRPVVIDNGSRRKTAQVIDEWASRAKSPELDEPVIIYLPDNLGFAGGINHWLREAKPAPYVMLMHNDVIPFRGWAVEMLACLSDLDDKVVGIMPRTTYANEQSVCIPAVRERFERIKPTNKEIIPEQDILGLVERTFPEGRDSFVDSLAKAEPRCREHGEMSSYCLLLRSGFFDKYGLFDEDFWPRGYEDKAWFHPMWKDGLQVWMAERAFVHHFGNITSDGPGFCFPDIMRTNEEKFYRKMLYPEQKGT